MTDMPDMSQMPPMPPVQGGRLNAYLTVDGAEKAAAFYGKALGAETVFAVPPDDKGRTMHVHLYLAGSSLMLADAYPDYGHPWKQPQGFSMQLQVDDIDAAFQKAIDAGMEVVTPVETMFWGARWGQLRDPFGVLWAMNQPMA